MLGKLKKLYHVGRTFLVPQKIPVIKTAGDSSILEGKVALITGGDGGIGNAIAKKFVNSGAKVVISGRKKEKLESCCKDLGENAEYVILDQTHVEQFDEVIIEAEKIFGGLDILVNSAGMHIDRDGLDFLSTTEREFDDVVDLNLKGAYFIAQAVAKRWISKKQKGHILFISSQSALEPSWSPYRLSKLGVRGITEGIAQQLLRYGIVVNGLGPGPTATTMQKAYKRGGTIYTSDNNIERYTMPEEVAEYATMLVSELGDTIVGDTLYMSGGRGIIDKR